MDCPKCGGPCERERTDAGVAIVHGPLKCPTCGWSEAGLKDWADDRASEIVQRVMTKPNWQDVSDLIAGHLRLAHCEGATGALVQVKTELAQIFDAARVSA